MDPVNSALEALNNSMSSETSMEQRPLENGTVENGHHSSSRGDGDKHHSKDKHHSSSKDKHHSSSKDKHHSSSKHSSSDKHHSSSSSKDKHHSSSSSKDKDKHSSSKHSSSSSSKHKDGHSSSKHSSGSGHHSSSSSSKHKDGSSSSKHRDDKHSSSSKHKDGSSSKHRDGSSSSKHKEGSSSSSRHHDENDFAMDSSSETESDRHKHSSSEKHKSSSEKRESGEMKVTSETTEMKVISETVEVKMEPPETPAKNGMSFDSPPRVKPMIKDEESDDDMPLNARFDTKPLKRPAVESDDEDEPLLAKMEKKVKKEDKSPPKRKKMDDEDEEYAPEKKKKKKDKEGKKKDKAGKKAAAVKKEAEVKKEVTSPNKKGGKKTKKELQEEADKEKYKWWEELGQRKDGTKWKFLEHKGPVFAPEYEPLPDHVRFYYDGKKIKLTPETEEVATFYARMLEHDYTSKDIFNKNFFKDWRSVMTCEEKEIIKDLSKCNFKEIAVYFKEQSEARKNATKEEKNKIKEQNAKIQEEYGFCTMDGHKEKIGNFRIEPPGLFRGRGTHPKMGMLKKRVMPEHVIINCSKDAKVPDPPKGHRWKEVRHDNAVTWLACWSENIQGATKYVMLNAASRLKGEKDWQKYETARKLHKCVDKIRASYHADWKSKEMRVRQRAVALYFIDKLALRAGNEKDEETADTVGCCSLRVEHITLHEKDGDQENVVVFDFLGKDSIRYYNKVSVEKRVFKNLQLFMQNKAGEDDLFDRLNTAVLNKHLQGLMDGLTAKVFRTFNASKTLQEQLNLLTSADDPVPAKLLSYNRANRAVAVLCNHQRAVPKNFDKQMENLQTKIDAKKEQVSLAKKEYKAAKADYKAMKTEKARKMVETKKKAVERLEGQLTKLEVQATDKDENKDIALGTSKLNYLDPRISVAWCKKWDVPIEKIYNKTQRDKFAWAIEMTEEDFEF